MRRFGTQCVMLKDQRLFIGDKKRGIHTQCQLGEADCRLVVQFGNIITRERLCDTLGNSKHWRRRVPWHI